MKPITIGLYFLCVISVISFVYHVRSCTIERSCNGSVCVDYISSVCATAINARASGVFFAIAASISAMLE